MFASLRASFQDFEAAYLVKDTDATIIALVNTINELEAIGYSKKDLTFVLDIEPLSFDRWKNGNGSMKPNTFSDFQRIIGNILEGRSQRPMIVSDTGFVTWQYVFETQQPKAKRIWYISEGRFLLNRSFEVEEAVKNLFLASRQEDEKREPPTIAYLYPAEGDTEKSLSQWKERVTESGDKELFSGTVIGIGLRGSLSWFQPGIRSIVFEMPGPSLEGYLRFRLAAPFQGNVLRAFGAKENIQHIQWIGVAEETVSEWYAMCRERFKKRVDDVEDQQKKQGVAFDVKMLNMD